jgi:trigger factor
MQVTVESGEGLEKRLSVQLPAEQVSAEVDKKLQQLARTVRLDGFRPGKVPLRVIKQRFGQQVRQEVYGDMIQATFYEAAQQQALRPAGEPKIELRDDADDGGFGYTATFEVVPEVTLGDLSTLSVKRPSAEVSDADVDAMIDKLRAQRTTWNEVQRPAQDGDTVHIDFKGFIDGEAFEGGAAENVPLRLGSGAMVEGFEEGLVGAGAGDSRTLEVQFPEDYRAQHLAGKAATFEVTVNKVAEPVLPAVDAEFAKAFGVEDGSEETLRTEIRANMERELRQKLRSVAKERTLDALLAAHPLTIPKAMVQDEAKRLKQQTQAEMAQSGQGNVIDFPVSMFEPQAERRVALGLLIGEIIRGQELRVDAERVRSTVEDLASSYENPQEVVDYYLSDKNQRAAIENLVLEDQVVDWVLDQAQVEDEPQTFEALMEGGKA